MGHSAQVKILSEQQSIAPRHYRAAATQDKREKKQNRIEREKEKKKKKREKRKKRARIRSEDEKYRVFSFVRPQGNPGSSPLAQPAAFCYLGVLT
jgi:hypothetical protein